MSHSKKALLFIPFLFIVLTYCSKSDTKTKANRTVSYEQVKIQMTYCYSCHNPNAPSHDDILAPPFAAVKKRYMMSYTDKDAFVNAVSSFAGKPEVDKALMRGAVTQYGVMVKAPFPEEELKLVAAYIFDNEIPEPAWFNDHQKQMQGANGMGNGMGKGKGNNQQNSN